MKELKIGKWGQHTVLVDDADYEQVRWKKWYAAGSRTTKMLYAQRWDYDGFGNRTKWVVMHRFILGIDDPAIIIDHKDRNSLNNQRSNLRICPSKKFNLINQPPRPGRKWKGAVLIKLSGRWRARVGSHHIGVFETEEEAARAYDRAATRIYGEFAYLNFP